MECASDDPDEPTRTAQLQGAGQGVPNISVQDEFDFGTVVIGQSLDSGFGLVNSGSAPLTVSSITGGSNSFIVDSPAPFTLQPGGVGGADVTFSPHGIGLLEAEVRIESNDPDEPIRTIRLKGRGTLGQPPQ